MESKISKPLYVCELNKRWLSKQSIAPPALSVYKQPNMSEKLL